MKAPKAKVALTRAQMAALKWWVIVAQREDERIVREYPCTQIAAEARARLAQAEAVNRAVWDAPSTGGGGCVVEPLTHTAGAFR